VFLLYGRRIAPPAHFLSTVELVDGSWAPPIHPGGSALPPPADCHSSLSLQESPPISGRLFSRWPPSIAASCFEREGRVLPGLGQTGHRMLKIQLFSCGGFLVIFFFCTNGCGGVSIGLVWWLRLRSDVGYYSFPSFGEADCPPSISPSPRTSVGSPRHFLFATPPANRPHHTTSRQKNPVVPCLFTGTRQTILP